MKAIAVRIPVKMVGDAAGSSTSHTIAALDAPMLRAAHTATLSTPLMPLKVLRITGSRQPRNTSTTLDMSPSPNHTSSSGISADFGSG